MILSTTFQKAITILQREFFNVNHGITEILRIVKPKATLELLKSIQHKYIEKLE